jgi:hypothetical protein
VIDQDSLMVVSENAGDIIYTDDFKLFIEEQDICMYVCRKADPETKGKIENVIKYVKYNFFNTRDFLNIEEANKSVFKWLKRRANGKISQATKQIPALLIENEREHLIKCLSSTSTRQKRLQNMIFLLSPGKRCVKKRLKGKKAKPQKNLKSELYGRRGKLETVYIKKL